MKKIILFLIFLSFALTETGCIPKYSQAENSPPQTFYLDQNQVVYVAVPYDLYPSIPKYRGTGSATRLLIQAALNPYISEVLYPDTALKEDEAIKAALKTPARYLFYPILIDWEEAQGIGSSATVTMDIKVFDLEKNPAKNGPIVNQRLTADGNGTFMSKKAKKMAEKLIDRFIKDIYLLAPDPPKDENQADLKEEGK